MCIAMPGAARPEGTLIWDLPLRIFHWSLALLVAFAFVSGWIGGNWMVWHGRAGVVVVGLLAFRLAWGFVGSTYARFAAFLRGPRAILDYVQGRWCGPGHNPLGALSVLAIIALLAFQVGCGLFANDDIAFNGPLYAAVGKDTSDWLAGWHRRASWLVLALIGLHLAAIMFYAHVKRDNLVRPMITGRKTFCADCPAAPARGGGFRAFVFALAVGGFAAYAAAGGFLPPPPPAAPAGQAW